MTIKLFFFFTIQFTHLELSCKHKNRNTLICAKFKIERIYFLSAMLIKKKPFFFCQSSLVRIPDVRQNFRFSGVTPAGLQDEDGSMRHSNLKSCIFFIFIGGVPIHLIHLHYHFVIVFSCVLGGHQIK